MKSTKKHLLLSIVSTLTCVAMLVGTTFAWFTDTVTSGKNKIVAGNLDIELEYSKNGTSWSSVQDKTDLFGDVTLWEPGSTSVVYLKLSNKGTLALKYNLAVTSTGGSFTNVNNESKNLKDALKFTQVVGDELTTYATREEALAAVESLSLGLNDFAQSNIMYANGVSYITLVVAMPNSIGNEFNYKTGTTAPTIDLSISLTATQYSYESDSFDSNYDILNTDPIEVYTANEFTYAVSKIADGGTIKVLKSNLDLTVAYDAEKTITLKGEKINSLTANIPNGTIHVYNEAGTVTGTNVDLQNSAHFYNNVKTLNATAGHFVIEEGAKVENIIATPVVVTATQEEQANAKELKIEVKGQVTEAITTPDEKPVEKVEIKVEGEVAKVEIPVADTKIAVKVVEAATITELKITDETENAKIVLVNDGTVTNESEIVSKIQEFATIDVENKTLGINNADELELFAEKVNSGNTYSGWTVSLLNDINLGNKPWTPIGKCYNDNGKKYYKFLGTFDGQDKTISNLLVEGGLENTPENAARGLFGYVESPAVIKNIKINNATISGSLFVGAVVGHAYTCDEISGIELTGDIKVTGYWYVGSVVGKTYLGKMDDVTVNAEEGSFVKGVGEDAGNIGGVIGWTGEQNSETVYENISINNVNVSGVCYVGGILGHLHTNCIIKTSSVSNAKISGNELVGEIAGRYGASKFGTVDTTCSYENVEVEMFVIITPENKATVFANLQEGTVVKGDGVTEIDCTGSGSIAKANNVTFENVVFNLGNSTYHGFQHSNVTFINCTIKGLLTSYDVQNFIGCKFIQTAKEYNMWAYGEVHYTDCEFTSNGKFVNVYNEGVGAPVTFTRCKFINTGDANKAAINVKDSCGSTHLNFDVTITDCTIEGNFPSASTSASKIVFSGLVMVDDIIDGTTQTKVTLDGNVIFPIA